MSVPDRVRGCTDRDAAAVTSRIPGFYRLPPSGRLDALEVVRGLRGDVLAHYRNGGLTVAQADLMVENVIGTFALPNAVAVNFLINGRDRLVPLVVEEPSVVAAVSYMAKLARSAGGFRAESDPATMIGQIQLVDVRDPDATARRLSHALPTLEAFAATVHPRLVERGGGIRGFEVRQLTYDEPGRPVEHMVVLHVLLDCVDAMGANMVNTLCEALAPLVAAATGETVGLKILSNLAAHRLARAWVDIPVAALGTEDLPGVAVAERIASAWRFAWADPYRAATHNKGVMNGIDALCLATGNDWRAVEAGAHAWCARAGQYRPMTRWELDGDTLRGSLEIPLQVGTVGGPIRVHPTVRSNLALLEVEDARDLASVCAAVGLAQNLGALRALATEGIQQGHMRMHGRTVAAHVGAEPDEVEGVVSALAARNDWSLEAAREALGALRAGRAP